MEGLKKFYQAIIFAGENFKHALLLIIRLYWGILFFFAGKGKFEDLTSTSEFFGSLGIPLPALNAVLAASVECFGGLLLILGLGSRLASLLLAITMGVAYWTAHFDAVKTLFQNPDNFTSSHTFNFLMAALIVFSFGPGAFSIDAIIKRFRKRV